MAAKTDVKSDGKLDKIYVVQWRNGVVPYWFGSFDKAAEICEGFKRGGGDMDYEVVEIEKWDA